MAVFTLISSPNKDPVKAAIIILGIFLLGIGHRWQFCRNCFSLQTSRAPGTQSPSYFLQEKCFLKWAKPGLFLSIFVPFKHNFLHKTEDFSRIRTWIVGLEAEHADHLSENIISCCEQEKDSNWVNEIGALVHLWPTMVHLPIQNCSFTSGRWISTL